jgi:hypothetical protein
MATYKTRNEAVEATQWFKNGDHPMDGPATAEGKVVRYYRHPSHRHPNWGGSCGHCHTPMEHHGWIDTPPQGHTVCPGDYVITTRHADLTSNTADGFYPMKPELFVLIYKRVG